MDRFKQLFLKKASFDLKFADNGFRMAEKAGTLVQSPQVETGKCVSVHILVCACMGPCVHVLGMR